MIPRIPSNLSLYVFMGRWDVGVCVGVAAAQYSWSLPAAGGCACEQLTGYVDVCSFANILFLKPVTLFLFSCQILF